MKRFVLAIIVVVVLSGIGLCQSEAKRRPHDPSPEDLAMIRAAVPNKATARPVKPRKMLVLSYLDHDPGRFAGEKMLAIMAEKTGAFEITLVEDKKTMARIMVPEELKTFDAVCLNNSTQGMGKAVNGKTFTENLSDYVMGGGGLVGFHAATDNQMGEVFGGFFSAHPWRGQVGVKIDDPDHTLTKVFDGEGFTVNDEIYQFTWIYSREKLRILLSLDMDKTKNKGQREDGDYAVAWVRAYGKGRVFYCSLGHNPQVFQDPKLVQFQLDGIQFALGDIKADMTPSEPLPQSVTVSGTAERKSGLELGQAALQAMLDRYNVVWSTQSEDSSQSMPCGGGDIGLNVWVENGDLLLYAQRSGSFDENNEYLKLGRVRLRLTPNPFTKDAPFRQELKLHEGYVAISNPGGTAATTIRVWVEVHRPIVHIDVDSAEPVAVEAAYEGWRNQDVALANDGKHSRFGCFSWDQYPGEVIRYHDEVRHEGDAVLFYHRNRDDKLLFNYMVQQQGLASVKEDLVDTQRGRTFGGMLSGHGFVAAGTGEGTYIITPYKAWKLKSERSARQHSLTLHTHVAQTETLDAWTKALQASVREASPTPSEAQAKTRAWWDAFWQRSWIVIDPDRPGSVKPWQTGRNYQLFRYQLGCNAYGEYPTKFNGGNFTFDPTLVSTGRKFTPDWRPWGGGSFTAQNQRLVYWPMLKTGDFDMMRSQFEFYRRALPNATARVKVYWGHEGCLFTEQMENFGLPIASHWGWEEEGARGRQRPKDFERGVQVNGACIYHYESQLEFSYMILEHHRFTGAAITPYMPFITQSVRFFDEHYQMREKKRTGKPLDDNGKLVIYPSTSCESYKGARNPSDLIAGLQACLTALLHLDDTIVPSSDKDYYRAFLARIPDYGYGEQNGDRIMKPAWSWERYANSECPQFYPLFPFDRFSLLKDDMTLFKNTWKHGTFPKDMVASWHQDGIFFARMGMTDEARDYNTKKMEDSGRRFPTFWGPGHDWVPDHNWGGSGMIGIQEMLMQTLGDTIHLLPAWPKAWNVDFKLHAPRQTTVEGRVRNGEIVFLKVTPEERRRNVVVGVPR